MSDCYHCGLPVPAGADFPVVIDGEKRQMCCPGCQAVATAIVDGGLDRFYEFRSQVSNQAADQSDQSLQYYDLPEIQADFVTPLEDGSSAATLYISGITCSACAWLIENYLAELDGVVSVSVNVSTHRCRILWRQDQIPLSIILGAFAGIGYQARPAGDEVAEKQRTRENRTFLLRLGLAGLASMQAGNAAIALYAGSWSGIDQEWVSLLRWVSLVLTLPVVVFSATPFYVAAWRSLKIRRLVMDVPVSLAIILAFVASVWATVRQTGEVYYDSVAMFAFFLLLARYLEMRVRHRNEHQTASLSQLVPPVAIRIREGREEPVPVKSLQSGDVVLVHGGQSLPCDGEVIRGASEVVEAILTGEQAPVSKAPGDAVSAGTVNLENPLEVRVGAVGAATRIAAILNLVDAAEAVKPRRAAMADRISGWFVGAVLGISALVALVWSFVDPDKAFWVSLSVLVVTCPCALSLATPAALTVATGELRKRGFLIRKPHVLEALAVVDRAIFDKTGTLTQGKMQLGRVLSAEGVDADRLTALAAALERGVTHPIAHAFAGVAGPFPDVAHKRVHIGLGVSGSVDGEQFVLGKAELIDSLLAIDVGSAPDSDGQWLVLAGKWGVLGWIEVVDELRAGAREAIDGLKRSGLEVELLSGDRVPVVKRMAETLGIDLWQGGTSPEEKLSHVQQAQGGGSKVMMVGDGINDVPVLSGADISVAMGDAVDLTRLHADSLLVSGSLEALVDAVHIARKTEVIIRQNLAWALGYNVLAIPLAALGFVPPWLAAIGMSASSLIVVANALRLSSSVRTAKPA